MATCSKHNGQSYVMVCKTCDKRHPFVCCDCIAKNHKGHVLETFKTAANTILDKLRKEKAEKLPKLKELHLELKNYETIRENERKISENTKQYITRRRDLLKLAIDEAAEILLEKQESSDKRIMDTLLCGKQEAEDQVRHILDFQSNLAILEISTDYQQIIQLGKRIFIPDVAKNPCPIPAVTKHTLRRERTVDRKAVRRLFGEEVEGHLSDWYILHQFDGKEEGDTASISTVSTTDLFEEDTVEHLDDSTEGQDAGSDGNVGRSFSNRHLTMPTACQSQETPQTSSTSVTPKSKQTPKSRDLTSSTTAPESDWRRGDMLHSKENFGEKTTLFAPHDQKLETQVSNVHASEYESKTMRSSVEYTGDVSTRNTTDNFDIKVKRIGSVFQMDFSNECYV